MSSSKIAVNEITSMNIADKIIYESNQLLVVNKPSGLITEDNEFEKENVESIYLEYLKTSINQPFLGIPHRLDKVTSGVLIFAKKRGSLKKLNRWFEQRKIRKTYLAIVNNKPPEEQGVLINYLEKDLVKKIGLVVDKNKPGAKKAVLEFQIIGTHELGYLLEIKPQTGRYHQIRTQLAFLGCPIIGDIKYGSKQPYLEGQIALHAKSIEFPESINNSPLLFEADLPLSQLWNLFK